MTNGDYMRSLSDEKLAHDILVWIVSNQGTTFDEDILERFILSCLKRPYDGE